MEHMDIVAWRAIERIIGVCVAGISIYLGYRLFVKLPEQQDSSGKVILPGNISIYMSRVGPGVFFALFGALIIGFSVYSSLSINKTVSEKTNGGKEQMTSTSYFSRMENSPSESDIAQVIADIRTITELVEKLEKTGGELRDSKNQLAIRRIKLVALKSIWSDAMGDYSVFEQWVLAGCQQPINPKISKAVAIYLGDEK